MFDIQDYISLKEAAEKLGYSYANITRLARLGKIPVVKRGRKAFVLPSDIEKYLLSYGQVSDTLS